ncbi:MAG TPA: glycosyltransferase [Rhizomicrobium sp.]|nr:glycosyltransferase [Rhizomicrobium sp.]
MGEDLDAADQAVWGLARAFPEFSAHVRVTTSQLTAFAIGCTILLVALVLVPGVMLFALAVALGAGFLLNVAFRCLLVGVGAYEKQKQYELPANTTLPIFSILVPVYRESEVLPALIQHLRAMDYPADKLDIRIVVEADDVETVAAANAFTDFVTVVCVPPCHPRTKPKACNFALPGARGEFLVIYDAEDKPEPDQLRKAVAAFRAAENSLACLQARLSFYNATDSWLAALFTLDYELWFGFLLPGLATMAVPMPLGGTSNHFRTDVLREIRGWDPFNVTEDADLGIRLAQKGYRVSTLDSTTFEEATRTFGNWTRQRSRWMKGYMQTWLVHMRDPRALLRCVGLRGFVTFQLFIGGAFFSALINPLLWLLFAVTHVPGFSLRFGFFAEWLGIFALGSLVLGNAIFTYLMMFGAVKRGWLQLVPCGVTSFFYWLLISVAAYRGLWQLIRRPFYWEKTQHGVARGATA